MSKRQRRSLLRLQEYQQKLRLARLCNCRLRKVALQVLKRLRFERMWRVFHESRATHVPGLACDSAGQTTAPSVPMEADSSANRAAPPAAEMTLFPDAEFAPGLPVTAVAAAWSSAAAAQDKQPATTLFHFRLGVGELPKSSSISAPCVGVDWDFDLFE